MSELYQNGLRLLVVLFRICVKVLRSVSGSIRCAMLPWYFGVGLVRCLQLTIFSYSFRENVHILMFSIGLCVYPKT